MKNTTINLSVRVSKDEVNYLLENIKYLFSFYTITEQKEKRNKVDISFIVSLASDDLGASFYNLNKLKIYHTKSRYCKGMEILACSISLNINDFCFHINNIKFTDYKISFTKNNNPYLFYKKTLTKVSFKIEDELKIEIDDLSENWRDLEYIKNLTTERVWENVKNLK